MLATMRFVYTCNKFFSRNFRTAKAPATTNTCYQDEGTTHETQIAASHPCFVRVSSVACLIGQCYFGSHA